MIDKIIFSFLVAIFTFGCSDEPTNQPLIETWVEQTPIVNRTEIVFEPNDQMKITMQNPERILSYTVLNISGDSIELSDNRADLTNNVKLYFKSINNESITMESLYEDEDMYLTFLKK